MTANRLRYLCLGSLVAAACGGDEVCDPIAQSGCEGDQVCEVVQDGEPDCFDPVLLRGDVFDLGDDSAIEGAHVIALDANRSPVSQVAVSGVDGTYELTIPAVRLADGTPASIPTVVLRADAAGYQTFPSGVRQPLPIDNSNPVLEDDRYVVESSLTSIGLLELPDQSAVGRISGTIEIPDDRVGVLVVAETGDIGYSAVADRDGAYTIFNLPDGDFDVLAYARGVNYDPASASIAGDELEDIDLEINDQEATRLDGKVDMVNPGDGDATSVILVVESTFDPALGRGEAVPGLRAPDPGLALDVTGDFAIEGVPSGSYVVLAAFEDDFLVRDPDTCIGGTDFVVQEVAGETSLVMDESFKITGALNIFGPGADGAEEVTGDVVFTWEDDSSEDEYHLVVVDSFGELVWETTVPGESGDDPAVAYEGPALEAGMFYQFRVTSLRTSTGGACEISATEDLKGVFYVP